MNKPKGQQITELKINHEELDYENIYTVVATNYLASGGDAFNLIENHKINHQKGSLDTDVFTHYVNLKSPILQKTENRINVIQVTGASSSFKCISSYLIYYHGLVVLLLSYNV